MAITCGEVRKLLYYNPKTGLFTWKYREPSVFKSSCAAATWNTRFAGKPAGCLDKTNGYIYIGINGEHLRAHRLAWLYITGTMPKEDIDHINRDRADNRLCNLRPANSSSNGKNQGMYATNTSGINGVRWAKHAKKWRVNIKVNGRLIHLGYFQSIKDAAKARARANRVYGFSKSHGLKVSA